MIFVGKEVLEENVLEGVRGVCVNRRVISQLFCWGNGKGRSGQVEVDYPRRKRRCGRKGVFCVFRLRTRQDGEALRVKMM